MPHIRLKVIVMSVTSLLIAASMALAQEGNWKQFADPFSKARGNCPDCNDGEAKVEAEVTVAHGVYVDIHDPPCGDAKFNSTALPKELKELVAAAFYQQSGPAGQFAISLGEIGLSALVRAGVNNSGSIGELIRGWTNQPQVANCTRLVVVLPRTVTINRIVTGGNCPGWCGWVGEPTTEEVDAKLFSVSAVVKNWSHDQDRRAHLRVYYKR